MPRKITEKNIKIHTRLNGMDIVEDTRIVISCKRLKELGAKRKVYKATEEVFYFITTNYNIIL